MRTRKQDTVAFVEKSEAGDFNCLTNARGDKKLILGDWFERIKVAVDESCNRITKAMRAGKAVAISQRMTINTEL